MTLKEIAKATGYSVSAVSKALAGAPDIGEEARKTIVEKAREYNYDPGRSKARRGEQPLTIGVVSPELTSRYFARILSCLDNRLREMGGTLAVCCTQYDPETERQCIRRLQSHGMVGGIIVVSPFDVADSMPRGEPPIVVISQTDAEIRSLDTIKVDDSSGIRSAIERFHELGHKKIAYLGETLTYSRLGYFKNAMKNCGLAVDESLVVVSKWHGREGGYEGMKKLILEKNLPTAVFAAYDSIAAGAMSALGEHGIRVPEDVSVAGLDNAAPEFHHGRRLTTIDCHIEEQADIALSILKKKIRHESFTAVQSIVIKTELMEYDTVAPAAETPQETQRA